MEQYMSLTPEQVHMVDTWHAIEKVNIPTLLHSISKIALITALDDRYHLSKEEAKALLTLSDLLYALTLPEQ
jgi:hypothetical protein